jgi:hypothetical protein
MDLAQHCMLWYLLFVVLAPEVFRAVKIDVVSNKQQ